MAIGPRAEAAEQCPPTAVVSGPPALAQELTRALIERGVHVEPAGLPPGDCAPLTVAVSALDGSLGVSIADAWGRTAERKVKDPRTAATLIESWAKMALLDGAARPTSTTTPAITAAAEPPAPAAEVQPAVEAAPLAEPAPEPAPEAKVQAMTPPPAPTISPLFRLTAEGGIGRDTTKWLGVSAAACARLGVTCLGIGARYAISQERQSAIDALAIFDVPIKLGPVTLSPGVGLGVGWLSPREQMGFFFGHGSQDDARLSLRAEMHLALTVHLRERLSLEAGMVATAAPRFGHGEELFGDTHLTIVRGQAGLVWGLP
ncbi:MAG: hypothetical protein U1E65_31415 [Myxococcota bacterium]